MFIYNVNLHSPNFSRLCCRRSSLSGMNDLILSVEVYDLRRTTSTCEENDPVRLSWSLSIFSGLRLSQENDSVSQWVWSRGQSWSLRCLFMTEWSRISETICWGEWTSGSDLNERQERGDETEGKCHLTPELFEVYPRTFRYLPPNFSRGVFQNVPRRYLRGRFFRLDFSLYSLYYQ